MVSAREKVQRLALSPAGVDIADIDKAFFPFKQDHAALVKDIADSGGMTLAKASRNWRRRP